jgi:hypothetical protein
MLEFKIVKRLAISGAKRPPLTMIKWKADSSFIE